MTLKFEKKKSMSRRKTKSKSIVAKNEPIAVTLKKGKTYHWCRCGRSKNQPLCDGSHRVTDITPVEFTAEEYREDWLCRCKQTHDQPHCDGHQAKIPDERVGKELDLEEGTDADSPPTFTDLNTREEFADHVRELTGGIPIGFKMSAQHIEADIEFAVKAGAD